MSEFISVCPKCRQRILCDTAYVGKRIACPLCLQEITMPEPPSASAPIAEQAAARVAAPTPMPPPPAAPPTAPPAPPAAKGKFPVVPAVIGAAVVVLAVVVGVVVMQKPAVKPEAAAPAVEPQHAAPAVEQPAATPETASEKAASAKNSGCRAIWTLDQSAGTTIKDLSGNGNTLTLMGTDAIWTTDALVYGHALKLVKLSSAEATGPVVNTAGSFTVAAWVKLNAIDLSVGYGYQTVLSIDGHAVSGFYLQFNPRAGNKFVFNRLDNDSVKSTPTLAVAKEAATAGTWYHLAGVYDESAQTIALYVNGKLQQSVPFTSAWQATGNTVLGRGMYSGKGADFLNGELNEVRFYASALNSRKIQVLAAKGAPGQE